MNMINKISRWVKALTTSTDDMNLITRTTSDRRELIFKSCPVTFTCVPRYIHAHMHIHTSHIKKLCTYTHTHPFMNKVLTMQSFCNGFPCGHKCQKDKLFSHHLIALSYYFYLLSVLLAFLLISFRT